MSAMTPLTEHVANGTLPGVVTAVERAGELTVHTAGTMAFGGSDQMRRDTLFRIASLTKPITAAAALTFVEDGTITLDEPVARLLPELAEPRVLRTPDAALDDTVPAARQITVADLMDFRWGFGVDLAIPPAAPILAETARRELVIGAPLPPTSHDPDAWLALLAELPLIAQPGERWLYDTGSDVLGVLLSRAAGAPLQDVLAGRVLGPLGMRDTAFHAAETHRLPPCYSDETTVYDPPDGAWSQAPQFTRGGGGLVSTVDDYLAFARALLRGGDPILTPESVAAMTTNHLAPSQRGGPILAGSGWGYGLAVEDDGSYGWAGGTGTSWFTDPATATIGILFTQRVLSEQMFAVLTDFRAAASA